MNAITYKEIFPLIKENKLWLGQNAKGGSRKGNSLSFITNSGETKDVSSWWFTNLSNERRNTLLDLYKHYSNEYKHYDNYDAIEVGKSCDVPMDYDGVIGVPISFLMFHCPEQFEILGITENADYLKPLHIENCEKYDRPYLDGKRMYSRLLIRHRK